MSPFNSRTTYKDVANSFSIFGGILFTPIPLTAVACYAAGPLKVRLSFRSQNVPLPPPKPLQKHQYRSIQFVTAHFSQLIQFWHCLYYYRLLWSSLSVEISTLSYEAKTLSWPERLSVAYCTHIIQTKIILKNQRFPQILTFTATEGPPHVPL